MRTLLKSRKKLDMAWRRVHHNSCHLKFSRVCDVISWKNGKLQSPPSQKIISVYYSDKYHGFQKPSFKTRLPY